ncbi:Carcinoembryonic antigen-related cell adhesion molecule 1, partial [Microtus ochrogaster]
VVFVTDGPDVPIISPSNTYFRSRTNLSLSCHSAALPPALYSWFVNGELVSSSQELFIPNITTNNSGSYTCFVYNSVTGLNKTTVKNNITALGTAKTKTTKKPPKQVTFNVFVVFDQSQIQESKEAFNMIDQNRDGFIHKEELLDMLASMRNNPMMNIWMP